MPCYNEIIDDSNIADYSTWNDIKNDVSVDVEIETDKSVFLVSDSALYSSSDVIGIVEKSLSDIVFDFSTDSSDTNVIPLVSSHTSGESLLGAVADSENIVSVITPSITLPYIYVTLLHLVSQRKRIVLHSPAFEVSDSLLMQSSPLHNLPIIKDTGSSILFSSSPQEANDMAIISHVIANLLEIPVIHSYNGIQARGQYNQVKIQSEQSLANIIDQTNELQSETEIFEEFAKFTSRKYSLFEYCGSSTATCIIIALNTYTSEIEQVKKLLNKNSSFGLLLVRVYRPWNINSFLTTIPSTANNIYVYQSSSLFSDVAGSFFHSKLARTRSTSLIHSINDIPELVMSPSKPGSLELFNVSCEFVRELFGNENFSLFQTVNCYRVHGTSKWNISRSNEIINRERVGAICCNESALNQNDTLRSLVPNGIVIVLLAEENLHDISDVSRELLLEKQANLILLQENEELKIKQLLLDVLANQSNVKFTVPSSELDNWFTTLESSDVNLFPCSEFLCLSNSSVSMPRTQRRISLSEKNTDERRLEMYWRFMFPESFQSKQKLKPQSKGIHQVTVTKWVRLTPESYDRNVFHIEMDISRTNLSYEIGEALGVYGNNCIDDVNQFLSTCEYDEQELVVYHSAELEQTFIRTLQQLLIQDIDLFGRPSKRFYSNLAAFATDATQKSKLEDLGDSAGADEFRARANECVTIAEILEEFSSAKPSAHELVQLIGPIKARHYSIASSMNAHPDSVHLLVVDHTWITPKGKLRKGQCTRYLQSLREGDVLSVSVKPSVMKLPENHETPIVMSGLGTGMAPFRAFIQERIYQAQQGHNIGEMVLYFGSRSSKQEYLYGEELEAFLATGMLTHMGLAFSRDQPNKIYIQHKISEDSQLLFNLLSQKNGCFYLCGPTWPASDVQSAISTIFMAEGNITQEAAEKEIAHMKAQERYILEVY